MDDLTFALSERMRAASWPDRWMTLPQIEVELDDQGFWVSRGLAAWSQEGRRHWLRSALATCERGRLVWLRMGSRYKHFDAARLNRADVDDYLTWFAEARAARFHRAVELLEGQHVVSVVVLHPLGDEAEYAEQADRLTRELIASIRDEQTAARLRGIWATYEDAGLGDPIAALRVCRLFCALCTLYVEWRGPGREATRMAVERAERWLDSRLCSPVEEEADEEPAAQAG